MVLNADEIVFPASPKNMQDPEKSRGKRRCCAYASAGFTGFARGVRVSTAENESCLFLGFKMIIVAWICVDKLYTERYNRKRSEEDMENKKLIMESAKSLFYAKGYDAVGVQEIVDKAGITKPTLYYYFGSKLGLLKTLIEVKVSDFRQELRQVAEMDQKIEDVLYRLAGAYSSFFDNDREFYMLFLALYYSARENEAYQSVKKYVTEYYEITVEIFERASHQLGNMNGRQRQFAIGFIGTINHYLMLRFEQEGVHGRPIEHRDIDGLVRQFMYGIFS